MLNLKQISKLTKLASGTFSPDEIAELLGSFGLEVAYCDVPADRKPHAFQHVAQFSLQDGAEVKHMTLTGKNGVRCEMLIVAHIPDESNSSNLKKIIDRDESTSLSLCPSH